MALLQTYVLTVLLTLWVILAIVICAYCVARAISFAYFRTRYEYLKKVLHRINGEKRG